MPSPPSNPTGCCCCPTASRTCGTLSTPNWCRWPEQGHRPGRRRGQPMELTPHARIAGDDRRALTSLVVERHRQGASLRAIAAELGRSYGFVHRLLDEAGVQPRHRGGDTRSPQARERRASLTGAQVAATEHITSTPEGGTTDKDAATSTDPAERASGQPPTKPKKKAGKKVRKKAQASGKPDVADGTSVSAKGAGERAKSQKAKVGTGRDEASKKAASKKTGNKKTGNKKASKRTLDKVTSDTSDKPGKSGRSGKAKKAKQS
uniref:helix-turn-helix domain-containing protein n=2 Tax=Aestuariimicrobium sp. T2.26MG-19.2B TaxID=3040679 RepID=UPI002541A5B0|nr:helix-turn-helix domain-containing protein [Aestuariimicrobium sp. T2.26MG-19.2B]